MRDYTCTAERNGVGNPCVVQSDKSKESKENIKQVECAFSSVSFATEWLVCARDQTLPR